MSEKFIKNFQRNFELSDYITLLQYCNTLKLLQYCNTKVNGTIYWNDVQENLRTGESEQSRTEFVKGRSFAYLVMLVKLVFRQSNIVCIGILYSLIVKTNNLAIF